MSELEAVTRNMLAAAGMKRLVRFRCTRHQAARAAQMRVAATRDTSTDLD
jgi:hypothetical protein